MEQYKVEEIEHRGLTISIYQDFDPESPREWDNLGTMAAFHSRYQLGDSDHGMTIEELTEVVNQKGTVALPLYLLDHSNLWMRTGNFKDVDPGEWDSGMVGYILVTREDILKEYSRKKLSKALREKVKQILQAEVETYSQYLSGEVYGYVVESNGEHIDSCFGFYGSDHEYMMEQAKSAADHYLKQLSANPM